MPCQCCCIFPFQLPKVILPLFIVLVSRELTFDQKEISELSMICEYCWARQGRTKQRHRLLRVHPQPVVMEHTDHHFELKMKGQENDSLLFVRRGGKDINKKFKLHVSVMWYQWQSQDATVSWPTCKNRPPNRRQLQRRYLETLRNVFPKEKSQSPKRGLVSSCDVRHHSGTDQLMWICKSRNVGPALQDQANARLVKMQKRLAEASLPAHIRNLSLNARIVTHI